MSPWYKSKSFQRAAERPYLTILIPHSIPKIPKWALRCQTGLAPVARCIKPTVQVISFWFFIGHMEKKMGLIENGGLDHDDQFISPTLLLPSCLRRAKMFTGKTGRRPILRRRRHLTRCSCKSLIKALDARIQPAYFAPSGTLHALGKKEGLRISFLQQE